MIEVPFILLPALLAVGIVAGLYGYAEAERRAFQRLLAAQHRQRIHFAQLDAAGVAFLAGEGTHG